MRYFKRALRSGILTFLFFIAAMIILASKPMDKMVFVQGGDFTMGNNLGNGDEQPAHEVILPDFYISSYEITFDEYDLFCKETGRGKPDDNGWGRGMRPVINISWSDAVEYCNWLSKREGLEPAYRRVGIGVIWNIYSTGFRLPSEAEWEYAARGGINQESFLYSGSSRLENVGWSRINSSKKINHVGRKAPNSLGIYDLSGNVREWCWDWYGNYTGIDGFAPTGPKTGIFRVLRGGSWFSEPAGCRISSRYSRLPKDKDFDIGFRVVRSSF